MPKRKSHFVGVLVIWLSCCASLSAVELTSTLLTGPVEDSRSSFIAIEEATIEDLQLFAAGILAPDFHIPFTRALGVSYKVGPLRFGLQNFDNDKIIDVISVAAQSTVTATLDFRLEKDIFAGRLFFIVAPLPDFRLDVVNQIGVDISKVSSWAGLAELKVGELRIDAALAKVDAKAAVAGFIPIGSLAGTAWAITASVPFAGIGVVGLEAHASAKSPELFSFLSGNRFSSEFSATFTGAIAWLTVDLPIEKVKIGLDAFGGVFWSLSFKQGWSNINHKITGGTIFSPVFTDIFTGSAFTIEEDPAWAIVLHPKINISLSSEASLEISRWIPFYHLWSKTEHAFVAPPTGPPGPPGPPAQPPPQPHVSDPLFMILLAGWQVSLKYSAK